MDVDRIESEEKGNEKFWKEKIHAFNKGNYGEH